MPRETEKHQLALEPSELQLLTKLLNATRADEIELLKAQSGLSDDELKSLEATLIVAGI